MFDIRKGAIYHTRGDTADFDINISLDGEPAYDYSAIFSVKRNLKDTTYLYQAHAEDGHIHISHYTTQELPAGDYYYDIEVHINDDTSEGRYITIGPYQYHLLADVTVER